MTEALEELFDESAERGPESIFDLKRKMRLEGVVTKVELFGAFVDLGVGTNGLVHISQLRPERVNRVSEVVSEGDKVTVWVTAVDPSKSRIGLTMVEPVAVDWDDIRAGQVYTGKVKRLERFGAFVDIGATRDGLVHVSEITSDYIQDPKEYVKAGDEIQVKVLGVDRKKRRIELSMKAIEDHLLDEEEDEETEDVLTAMEVAWRQAQGPDHEGAREARRRKGRKRRKENDIFSRTLRLRGEQE